MSRGCRLGHNLGMSDTITVGVAASAPDSVAIADATCRNTSVTCGPTLIAFHLADSAHDELIYSLESFLRRRLTCKSCMAEVSSVPCQYSLTISESS